MVYYDPAKYYVDFQDHSGLTDDEKAALKAIQENLLPLERADILTMYRIQGKITDDEFSTMTGIPQTC